MRLREEETLTVQDCIFHSQSRALELDLESLNKMVKRMELLESCTALLENIYIIYLLCTIYVRLGSKTQSGIPRRKKKDNPTPSAHI